MRNESERMVHGLISTWNMKSPHRLSLSLLLDDWKSKEPQSSVKIKSVEENKWGRQTSYSYVTLKCGLPPTNIRGKCRSYTPPRIVTARNVEVLNNSKAEEKQEDLSSNKLPSKFDGAVPWKETQLQCDDLKADDTDTKGGPNEHFSKVIKSEAVSISPFVKRTSEQVGRQLEERVSRIEEQVHRFINSD